MVPFPSFERAYRGRSRHRQAAAIIAALSLVSLLAACGGGHDEPQAPAAGTPGPAGTAEASGGGSGTVDDSGAGDSGGAGAVSGSGGAGSTATVLAALNAARASPRDCGSIRYPAALPLAVHADVEAAAESHTRWMQANRTMSHTGADGSSVGTRLTETGYLWSAVGENVATGQSSSSAVVAAWLASPGHCANIMNAAFVDVGFGFAPSVSGASTYATLVLARPR